LRILLGSRRARQRRGTSVAVVGGAAARDADDEHFLADVAIKSVREGIEAIIGAGIADFLLRAHGPGGAQR
jgi:hypothetical protein